MPQKIMVTCPDCGEFLWDGSEYRTTCLACGWHDIKTGDVVTWTCTPRGGYAYSYPVLGTVIKVTPKRVLIEVSRIDGALVQRWVKHESVKGT